MKIKLSDYTSVLDRETDDIPIILMTFRHKELPEEGVRISTDNTALFEMDDYQTPVYGTMSRGGRYLFCPLTVTLPTANANESSSASITLDGNPPGELIQYIRKMQTADGYPTVTIEVLLYNKEELGTLDNPVAVYPALNITQITYSRNQLTAALSTHSLAGEAYPNGTFSPTAFPALFGVVQ